MEKYLEIFCSQNPIFDYTCHGCNTVNNIPTKELLENKYSYIMTCKYCGKTTTIDTHDFHKELEKLKLFQS